MSRSLPALGQRGFERLHEVADQTSRGPRGHPHRIDSRRWELLRQAGYARRRAPGPIADVDRAAAAASPDAAPGH